MERGSFFSKKKSNLPFWYGNLFLFLHPFLNVLRKTLILEEERGIRQLLVPVFLSLGILFYFELSFEPMWSILLACLSFSLCFGIFFRKNELIFSFFIAIFLFSFGALCAKVETVRCETKMLGSPVSTQLTGYILQVETLSRGGTRFLVDVLKTEKPFLRHQPERIQLYSFFPLNDFVPGSFFRNRVRIQPPLGPSYPGGYDFSFKSFFDKIGANGFFLHAPEKIPEQEGVSWIKKGIAHFNLIRNRIAQRIRDHMQGSPEGEVAAALLVGVRSGLSETINESLRRTGLAHILSISGLHLALVAGFIMVSIRFTFSFFPRLSSRWPIKKYAAFFALVAVTFYLFLSGLEVAAQRSFIMLSVMLLAVIFDQTALTMRNVALAATLVLILSPHEIISPGFQMSFSATACLIAGYQLIQGVKKKHYSETQSRFYRLISKAFQALFAVAFTSLIAGFASGLYGAWRFKRIVFWGVLANIGAAPIVSCLIMPFGLLAILAMPFGFERIFLLVMKEGLEAMLTLSDWLSERLPMDRIVSLSTFSLSFFTLGLLLFTITSTWLGFLGIPFFALGLFFSQSEAQPDFFISEDASLVALKGDDSRIFVNRTRYKSFLIKNWEKNFGKGEIIKPLICKEDTKRKEKAQKKDNLELCVHARKILDGMAIKKTDKEKLQAQAFSAHFQKFICIKNHFCFIEHPIAGLIVLAENVEGARSFCTRASLLILQDPSSKNPCEKGVVVITARDLALLGSAAVRFSRLEDKELKIEYRHSLSYPFRPWHAHRSFSRAARGLSSFYPKSISNRDKKSEKK